MVINFTGAIGIILKRGGIKKGERDWMIDCLQL